MVASHVFALPHGRHRTVTTESANPIKDRKRKRAADEHLDSASDNGWAPEEASPKSPSPTSTRSPARPEQREQYRLSGLTPSEEVPLHPFPHAPQRPRATALDRVRHELHSLSPPLAHLDLSRYDLAEVQDEGKEGLHERHVANLIFVMHHMLLRGDYERAGRAWGLLLRSGRLTKNAKSNTGYLSMDVTAGNLWGVGAELLMRNTRQHHDMDEQSKDMHFSEAGFRAAREYYERLIVQYPVHHQRKGPGATDFYAAMFSLWIYEASQRSEHAEQSRLHDERESSMSPAVRLSSSDDDVEDDRDSRLRAEKARELVDARMIASRLDDIIGAPPHDKNAELLQIRGMVALWLGTLQGGGAQETAFDRAKALFLRSRANGGILWEGVDHIVDEDDW
ncbi:hypothetical protein FKW77_010095 [Venturia effusa]|uniref:Uncharacterized protein n=1 Tax=Venturia effusa TaxID=50376 RepID=A0A517L279_9PEZI|nr:hypothetical protein FKW77_010095 [Venturia effusa]